jgi:hypothetical protein
VGVGQLGRRRDIAGGGNSEKGSQNDEDATCSGGPMFCALHFTKSDTDGEVSFAGIYPLTNSVFRFVPNVNRAYFKLRHQYQKCTRADNT